MAAKTVAVIGAGVSGLTAIKACLEEGLEPVAFEKRSEIGGLWNYDGFEWTDSKGPSVYKSLVTNTSKEMQHFSDFPLPADCSPYITHQECLKYLNDYADHFKLRAYINFNHVITKIEQASDYDVTGKWRVAYRHDGGEEQDRVFDYVMICTGFFSEARKPSYPGQDAFGGLIIHTNQYRTPDQFIDKNVLVVGESFSAGDVAVELGFHSKQVYISMREGCFVFPKRGEGGWPLDILTNTRWRFHLPEWLNRFILQRFIERDVNYDALGLRTKRKLFCSRAIANDFVINQIMHGRVRTRPAIKRFYHRGVEFVDGTTIDDLDAIVFGTGYAMKTPFIDDSLLSDDLSTREMYKYVLPVRLKHPTLVCVGFLDVYGALPPVSEMQARWAARVFTGAISLPPLSAMLGEIEVMRKLMYDRYNKHIIGISPVPYEDNLAADVGCLPTAIGLLSSDPRLAVHMFFSPGVPATYRLMGPNSWPGARDAIMKCWENNLTGTRDE
ncbi:putative dimethylaniline monooxygenase [Apostichopus japonicus]|uniref:Flavin-containing monooxygenase n=1 Tax=Stichopus japonicus TaxID=307972 RepID=A0A2G8JGK8_STIJA|nr:putative dimethylaniline monooxygenase [Apostichopus japonicus]